MKGMKFNSRNFWNFWTIGKGEDDAGVEMPETTTKRNSLRVKERKGSESSI